MEIDKKLIGLRIKQERNNLHLTQEELAVKLGLNNKSSISQYESGDAIPSDDIKILMANIFNCSIDYLLGKSDKRNNESSNINSSFINIPVLGKIAAGKPIFAQEYIEGVLPVDPNIYGISSSEDYFYLRVSGNSMNQKVKNGDYALIHKQNYAENGDIIVAIVNGDEEATLKKYKKINDDLIALEPQSDDLSYEPIYVDKNTKFQIIGKAIGQFGKF